ncbi:MAG: hypothetical protein AB1649_27640 [Chloroflexota bacterium]
MVSIYSVERCKDLENRFAACQIDRPLKVERYDAGDRLTYDVAAFLNGRSPVHLSLLVEQYVGGGFAGQVYKVGVLSVEGDEHPFQPGQTYALKIFIPPSHTALFFRNFLYGVGFQGAFQLQANPAAARAGALWQKFIRRAAALRFQDESTVNDILGTLVDHTLGSCGEISNWVDGRTWRLEVDEHTDQLVRWERGLPADADKLGSPEYRAKKTFMHDFVDLLHEMGAHEFARQYEWSTWKSQPNVLKRLELDHEPDRGLTAVDFRAGLTLLPFLPMSPGDFKLIWQGLKRGSLVQFDRGNLKQLEAFVQAHRADFAGMLPLLDELKECERIYRESIPDITHNHVRLLSSSSLWSTIADSAITGWCIRNLIDDGTQVRLRKDRLFFLFFALLGFIPLFGSILRKAIGQPAYRSHYRRLLYDFPYLQRTFYARRIESLINWHREGRITESRVELLAQSLLLYLCHLLLSILPTNLHRFLSDREFFMHRMHNMFMRPLRLYFDPAERREWLMEMVADGRSKKMISQEDAAEITSHIEEPYINKYLQSLAVHVMLSPTTHIVSFALAAFYVYSNPDMPRAQAYAVAAGIIALFQLIPVSPGSLARGLYVLYIVLKERNLKDYSVALFLAFFKYIGYLSFPIQMTYRYPTLARFMAGYWATETVHFIPVFGERGALLEHKIFTLFYNLPLTVRRKMSERAEVRKKQKPRSWHAAFIVLTFTLIGALAEYIHGVQTGSPLSLERIAPTLIVTGFLGGILVNVGSGGASSIKRVILAVASGVSIGVLITLVSVVLNVFNAGPIEFVATTVWRSFITGTLCAVGAVLTEFKV